MKLNRKQEVNILYQVCDFGEDRKNKMASDILRHFYAPGSNDRGHIVFVLSVCLFVCLSVCLFVCLLSTLTFAITFEPLEVETSYLAYLACILY